VINKLNLLKHLIDFIFPKCCLICNEFNNINNYAICENCWKNLSFSKNVSHCYHCGLVTKDNKENNLCIKCELLGTYFDDSKSVFIYDVYTKQIVTSLKFNDQTIFAKFVAKIISDYLLSDINNSDFIIPIPIHKRRLLKRKYNQSVLIARFIKKFTKIPIKTDIIVKLKNTRPQSLLSMEERKLNLHNAFSIKDHSIIKGSKIILLDDVVTTGSTVASCAKLLSKYMPDKITVISFARSVIN
jgi:ComF family protein